MSVDQSTKNKEYDNILNKDLPKLQSVLTRMLEQFDKICKENNLTYWIDYGTFLGAIRHNGFIPWDDDVDISMPRKDYEQFKKIAKDIMPDNIFFQTKKTNPEYRYYWIKLRDRNSIAMEGWERNNEGKYHMGISLDIFPMDYIDSPKAYMFFKNWFVCVFKNKAFNFIMRILRGLFVLIVRKPNVIKLANWIYSGEKGKYMAKGYDCPFRTYFRTDDIFPLKEYNFDNVKLMGPGNHDNYLKHIYGDYMKIPNKDEIVDRWHYIKFNTETPCKYELGLRKSE